MASAPFHLLLLLTITVALLARPTTARPCKTIFFITTTTTSSIQNPNFPLYNPHNGGENQGSYLTFFFTETREFHPRSPSLHSHRPIFFDRTESNLIDKPYSSSSVKTSIRDRTMDIMSIVGALLFGVGCGALTAATMYLVWSLFSPRRFDIETDSDEEFDDGEEEYESDPKKMEKIGYVAIPAVTDVSPPAPAKEVA